MDLDERVRVVRAERLLPWTQDREGSVRYVMPDGVVRVRLDDVSSDFFFQPDQLERI